MDAYQPEHNPLRHLMIMVHLLQDLGGQECNLLVCGDVPLLQLLPNEEKGWINGRVRPYGRRYKTAQKIIGFHKRTHDQSNYEQIIRPGNWKGVRQSTGDTMNTSGTYDMWRQKRRQTIVNNTRQECA